ncbi:MAG: ATP-binding cassette domain-containing protein [Sphaerochaetaceae bacterium]
MGDSSIVSLKNVSVGYSKKPVLNNITLGISQGEKVLINGSNGSGKSTLLKLIGGSLEPWSGSVAVLNTPLTNNRYRQTIRRHIGILTQIQQETQIAVSVEESVLLGLWSTEFSYLRRSKREDRLRVKNTLKSISMDGFAKRDIRSLSGGQRQKVALGRALIRNPKLLMMDEPTTYLDSYAKEELIELIDDLWQELNFTLIVVSHENLQNINFNSSYYLEGGSLGGSD